MTEPQAGKVFVGAGTLWLAPLGSPEPAAGVMGGPLVTLTSPATSTAWPSAWTQLGYTTEGSEWGYTPKFDPIEVAESLLPLRYVASMAEAKVAFALAEMTAAHMEAAFNGGTVATASGITTFTPPQIGQEIRVMLGWDSTEGLQRIIWRQCIQVGEVKQEHKKSPAIASIPCEFQLEVPATGAAIFEHYFDAQLAT